MEMRRWRGDWMGEMAEDEKMWVGMELRRRRRSMVQAIAWRRRWRGEAGSVAAGCWWGAREGCFQRKLVWSGDVGLEALQKPTRSNECLKFRVKKRWS
jgi:hypothetical protein